MVKKAKRRKGKTKIRIERNGKSASFTVDASGKRLGKEIRQAARIPSPPKNPFAALMQPLVIVPELADDKPVVADAGSIVELMDQGTLYRTWVSPITRNRDEILVRYGKPSEPILGWITNQLPDKALKPVKGPIFLVRTKDESALSAWDRLRLQMRRSGQWLVPWIVDHADKHKPEIREVIKAFGGTPIKNEPTEVRSQKLFSLILHAEMDVATAKAIAKNSKSAKKSKKVAPEEKTGKKSKKIKEKPTKKSGKDFNPRSSDFDNHVIRRLIKENPRRAGSEKAKVWDRLRKGMTVAEFCKKGGTRSIVAFYIRNGWVKLLTPSGASDAE